MNAQNHNQLSCTGLREERIYTNTKLLLVNPRCSEGTKYPPLSLIWLAAYIEKHGYNVEIIDANAFEMRDEDLIEYIVQSETTFCGFTFMTPQADYVAGLIRKIKQLQPQIILLAGGVHVSIVPDDFLNKCPEVDYLIVGEGEVTLLELMESIIQSKDTENIQGIAFIRGQNIKINPRRALLSNLDELPMPAWSKLPIHKYDVVIPERDRVSRPGECLSISSERGCPFQCTFCASGSVYGKTCRSRSPNKTFEELQYLAKNHGIYKFFIVDEVLTLKESTILGLCDLIEKNGLSISWACDSRCNSSVLTEKVLSAMKKAGCVRIDFGVESGSPKVLKNIRKGITLKDIYRSHKMAHDIGMHTTTLMMFGQPDETIEDFRMSLKLLLYLESEVIMMGPATPFPGTELYTYAVKNNYLRVANNDWKEFYIGNMNHIMRTEHFNYNEMVDIAFYGHGTGDIIAKLSNYKRHRNVNFLNTLKLYISILLDVISWLPVDYKALWIKLFLLKRSKPEYVDNIINTMPIVLKEIKSYDFSINWDRVSNTLPPRGENTVKCIVFAGTSSGLTNLLNNLQDKYGKNLQVTVVCNDDAVKLPQEFVTNFKGNDLLKGDFEAVFYLENRKGFHVLFSIGLRSFCYRLFHKLSRQFIVYPKEMRFWEINIDNVFIALTGIKNRQKAVKNLLCLPAKLIYLMYLTLRTKEMRFKEKIIPSEAQ